MKSKIALIQIDVIPGDSEGNLNRAIEALLDLPGEVDMACLPEMFTTGFDYELIKKDATSLDGPIIEALSTAARKKDLWLVGGSIPEKRIDGIYNTAVLIDSDGEIDGAYRKTHLFPLMGEDEVLLPGNDLPVFDTPFGTIGIQICYDLRFPEVTRALAEAGATIIIQPAQFPYPRLDHWQTLTRSRAIENQIYFAAVNRCGVDDVGHFFGHSVLLDPWGVPVVEAGEEANILIGEIDSAEVDSVRKKIPCWESRRRDIY